MRLKEAYDKLQWESPLKFKRDLLGDPPLRQIGTSSLMLVELYLDMHKNQSQIEIGPVDFLVLCKSASAGIQLRDQMETISKGLGLPVDLDKVRFFPHGNDVETLGARLSWAIFCDHEVKCDEDVKPLAPRLTGPSSLIRRVVREETEGSLWTAYDRDDWKIAVFPDEGKDDILRRSPSPITVRERDTTVTHSAALAQKFHQITRLRKGFTR